MLAATEAFIQLKSYKKKEGFWEEKYRNKDIAIAWYEKYVTKCETQDSLNTIYRNNDALIIKDLKIDLKECNYELTKERGKSKVSKILNIVLAILLPPAFGGGVGAGIYLAK